MQSNKRVNGKKAKWNIYGLKRSYICRSQALAVQSFPILPIFRISGVLSFFCKGKSSMRALAVMALLLAAGSGSLYAQVTKMDLGYIYNENGVSFSLVLNIPKTRCGESAKPWRFNITANNADRLRPDQRYLSWKLQTENCSGYRITRAFSIDVKQLRFENGVPQESKDWNFEASSVENRIIDARLGATEQVEKDKNLGLNTPLVLKGSIDGASKIMEGDQVTLQISPSNPLPEGAELVWYEGSCGSRLLQRGSVLRVKPDRTTTYYVRAELGTELSECVSKEVIVNSKVPVPEEVANGKFKLFGELYNKDGLTVELYAAHPAVTCGTGAGNWELGLRFIVDPSYIFYQSSRYLVWNLEIGDCSELMVQKEFSFDLQTLIPLNPGKLVSGGTLRFQAKQLIESQDFNAMLQGFPNPKKDAVLRSLIKMNAPDSIGGNRIIEAGQTIRLSVLGPTLPPGVDWVWYEGGCDTGKEVARGSVFEASPQKNTTYYVRSAIGANTSPCKTVAVTVRAITRAPAGIVPEDGSAELCRGGFKTMEIRGGSLADNAYWVWYQNSITDQNRLAKEKIGKLTVSPIQTTTYIVRAESPDSVTSSVRFTVKVQGPPEKLLGIQNKGLPSICEGEKVALSAVGGIGLKEEQLIWYKTNAAGVRTNLGQGREIVDNPAETATYFVYAHGECGDSEPVWIGIYVSKNSINPTKDEIVVKRMDNQWKYSIQTVGGRLSEGQQWVWTKDTPDGQQVGEGAKIELKTSKDVRLFCKATGTCVSGPPAVFIVAGLKSPGYTFLNGGLILNNLTEDGGKNLYVMMGGKRFFVKATILGGTLIRELNAYDVTPTYVSNDTRLLNFPAYSGSYYKFNDQKASFVGSYTLGPMMGAQNFRLYTGLGFGFYDLLWGIDTYSYNNSQLQGTFWAKNIYRSIKGAALETGLFLKTGNINFTGGIHMVYSMKRKINYVSGQVGIGYQLNR